MCTCTIKDSLANKSVLSDRVPLKATMFLVGHFEWLHAYDDRFDPIFLFFLYSHGHDVNDRDGHDHDVFLQLKAYNLLDVS